MVVVVTRPAMSDFTWHSVDQTVTAASREPCMATLRPGRKRDHTERRQGVEEALLQSQALLGHNGAKFLSSESPCRKVPLRDNLSVGLCRPCLLCWLASCTRCRRCVPSSVNSCASSRCQLPRGTKIKNRLFTAPNSDTSRPTYNTQRLKDALEKKSVTTHLLQQMVPAFSSDTRSETL